jgi:hypothetical protein
MRVEKDFEEFIELLNKNEVKYVIVGAYAISFHGRPRNTGDIDFFISNSKGNIENLLTTLKEFGFDSLKLTVDDFGGDKMLQLGYEPNRIDILTDISGITFAKAWNNREKGIYGHQTTYFISLDDLIKNKKASNRNKDISDLELLEKLK